MTDPIPTRFRRLDDVPELAGLRPRDQARAWGRCRRRHDPLGWTRDHLLNLVGVALFIPALHYFAPPLGQSLAKLGVPLPLVVASLLIILPVLAITTWVSSLQFNATAHRLRPYLLQCVVELQQAQDPRRKISPTAMSDCGGLEHWRKGLIEAGARIVEPDTDQTPERAVQSAQRYARLAKLAEGTEGVPAIRALLDSLHPGQDFGAYQPAVEALARFPAPWLADTVFDALPGLIDHAPDRAAEVLDALWIGDDAPPHHATAFDHRFDRLPDHHRDPILAFTENL